MGKLPGEFSVQLVPAGHVVDQNNSRKRPGTEGACIVGIDQIVVVALQHNSLGKHSLIHVSRVLMHAKWHLPTWLRNRAVTNVGYDSVLILVAPSCRPVAKAFA